MLSYDQIMHFNAFGFLKIPGLFSVGEIGQIMSHSQELFSRDIPGYDGTKHVNISNVLDRSPLLTELLDDDRLHCIPEGIIGPDFIYHGSGAHRHVGDTPWHGGVGSIVKWPIRHIKVSIYADSLNEHNGCLRVIPGSHRNYLRMLDTRWSMAPDYFDIFRYGRFQADDFRPFGLAPTEVPYFPLRTEPGDVLVHTEDILHASFGGAPGRFQLDINFIDNPIEDVHINFMKSRNVYVKGEFNPSANLVNSEQPRIQRMVARLIELGFETSKV